MAKYSAKKDQVSPVVETVQAYFTQSEAARKTRIAQNEQNLDCFHLRQDFSYKIEGQSTEFLAKQQAAVEQFKTTLLQGLVDKGDWFTIERQPGALQGKITADEMKRVLRHQLEKAQFYTHMSDALHTGALQALMITKVLGKKVPRVKFRTELRVNADRGVHRALMRDEKDVWQLSLDLVRPADFHQDPTAEKLYEIEVIEMDYWKLLEIAEQHPEDYDMAAVTQCFTSAGSGAGDQNVKRARENNQDVDYNGGIRKRVVIKECWGTILDPQTGRVLHRNAVCAIANDRWLIRPPKPNPLWHQESPFTVSPILRVPFSVEHRALADAPTKHNLAQNEVYNLMLDAGKQSVWGVRTIREHWLDDPGQIAKGIPPGTTLKTSTACPPGQQPYERVDTGTEFSQAANIYNITDREFFASSMSGDSRTGMLAQREVKATEIVASNQAITGSMNGIAKVIEDTHISPTLRKCWMTIAQHYDDFDSEDIKALFGDKRANELATMSPADRFSDTAQGSKFRAYGLSTTLHKMQDFQKLAALLQTLAGSPELMAEFSRKYDMSKFLGEVIKNLDIDESKIKRDDLPVDGVASEQPNVSGLQSVAGQIGAEMQGRPSMVPGSEGQASPDRQSQIPQAASGARAAEAGLNLPRADLLAGMTRPQG